MKYDDQFSSQSLEAKPGTHVFLPDLDTDYRSIHNGKIIKTISNPNPGFAMEIVNEINLPPFCTATNNPGKNSWLKVTYTPGPRLLEVFTFEKYINAYIGHMIVRDVEYLTQEIARECATVLGLAVQVEAYYEFVGFKYGQGMTCRVSLTQAQAIKFREEYPEKYQKYLDSKTKPVETSTSAY